jgi:hypothetical protein
MRKLIIVAIVLGALFVSTALPAFAHEGGNDFVCPVFNSDAVGAHNPNAVPLLLSPSRANLSNLLVPSYKSRNRYCVFCSHNSIS